MPPPPETLPDDPDRERRIERILQRVRHEVGLRDLLTFCGTRVWIALLAVGAAVYVAIAGQIETPIRKD